MKLLDRIFRHEEINGAEFCPTYLHRWTLFRIGPYALYLHHFVGDDWSRDLHDHPKRFISIGLKGAYVEEYFSEKKGVTERKIWRAPWIRTFSAEHIHRIEARDCWTLVLVLKNVRPWGFWTEGEAWIWVPWRKYVGSKEAWRRKSCPGGES